MQIEQNKLWDRFYSSDAPVCLPSAFAQSVLLQLKQGWNILDVGCGNGRDSIFFARNGIHVTAIDRSPEAIHCLRKSDPTIRAICGDAVTASIFRDMKYDGIYSRFFIHALPEEQATILLKHCYDALHCGGILFIETRCIMDELCGVGERISDTEWLIDGHYRRFIVPEQLISCLSELGFINIQSECARGFAPFRDADPVILRVKARK